VIDSTINLAKPSVLTAVITPLPICIGQPAHCDIVGVPAFVVIYNLSPFEASPFHVPELNIRECNGLLKIKTIVEPEAKELTPPGPGPMVIGTP
jgi:hypothetical protein